MKIIENYINELRKFITISKLSYDAWWSLAGDGSAKHESIRKKFPTHFNLSKHAYLSNLIITLYMTLEDDKNTKNIYQLVKRLKKDKRFQDEHINHIENEISKAEIIWKKIRILRCNQFAHCNFDLSQSGVFNKAEIKPIELKKFIGQLEHIINYISNIYNNSTHAFNIDDKYSTRQFMDSLIK